MGPCSDNCLNNFAKVQFLLDKISGLSEKNAKTGSISWKIYPFMEEKIK
jgi:hypothetical protein